jgi:Leucine-rich repeat (LRR) protein
LSGCGALKELRMAHNRLKALPTTLGACENLRILDLSHNRFEKWGDVAALSSLSRLQQLSLRRGCTS